MMISRLWASVEEGVKKPSTKSATSSCEVPRFTVESAYTTWPSSTTDRNPTRRPSSTDQRSHDSPAWVRVTRVAVDADRAAVSLDDQATKVEADAETPVLCCPRGGAPDEALEDARLLVVGDAGAAVADRDARERGGARELDHDRRPGGRVARGVL